MAMRYGQRSPYQTGTGFVPGPQGPTGPQGPQGATGATGATGPAGVNTVSIPLELVGNNLSLGLPSSGSGLIISSGKLVTSISQYYGSFDLSVPGVVTGAQVLNCNNKSSNSLNMSATSNAINTVSGCVYEINGWIHHQLNSLSAGTTSGIVICNSSTGAVVLDCTWSLPSPGVPQNPACSCVTGFFSAPGPVDIRIYNAAGSGTVYAKEGDLSIKRIV